jgi:hypothetical protein
MTAPWIHPRVRETDIAPLAELLAYALRPGDVVALRGDLGAGKSTLARAIIRVLLQDEAAEVPSPTFSLVQTYATPRFPVSHFDLYRLGSADEARELGLEECIATGAALIEWPERAEELLPADRIEVHLEEDPSLDPSERRITIEGLGTLQPRIERLRIIDEFLQQSGWGDARLRYLQGDASARRFARLSRNGDSAILMDAPRQPDGPPIRDGKPYSRIAHLAEDLRPWVAVTSTLRSAGLSAPRVIAQDLDAGLLLVEDFGDNVFSQIAGQEGVDQAELWRSAVDVLVHLRSVPVPRHIRLSDGSSHQLPRYDRAAMQIEVELLLDWYWPALYGQAAPDALRSEYLAAWNGIFDDLLPLPTGLVLRDYHSPNLVWLPDRSGLERVGILDCQDAVEGHPAYDLASLLQDARVDVPQALEHELFDHYCAAMASQDPAFDRVTFAFAYAALGAQRNTKVLGIFTRLSMRDGKNGYLRHIPRIWGYLERDLAHARLRPLKAWYDANFPVAFRIPPD